MLDDSSRLDLQGLANRLGQISSDQNKIYSLRFFALLSEVLDLAEPREFSENYLAMRSSDLLEKDKVWRNTWGIDEQEINKTLEAPQGISQPLLTSPMQPLAVLPVQNPPALTTPPLVLALPKTTPSFGRSDTTPNPHKQNFAQNPNVNFRFDQDPNTNPNQISNRNPVTNANSNPNTNSNMNNFPNPNPIPLPNPSQPAPPGLQQPNTNTRPQANPSPSRRLSPRTREALSMLETFHAEHIREQSLYLNHIFSHDFESARRQWPSFHDAMLVIFELVGEQQALLEKPENSMLSTKIFEALSASDHITQATINGVNETNIDLVKKNLLSSPYVRDMRGTPSSQTPGVTESIPLPQIAGIVSEPIKGETAASQPFTFKEEKNNFGSANFLSVVDQSKQIGSSKGPGLAPKHKTNASFQFVSHVQPANVVNHDDLPPMMTPLISSEPMILPPPPVSPPRAIQPPTPSTPQPLNFPTPQPVNLAHPSMTDSNLNARNTLALPSSVPTNLTRTQTLPLEHAVAFPIQSQTRALNPSTSLQRTKTMPTLPQTPYMQSSPNLPLPNNQQIQYNDNSPNLPLPKNPQVPNNEASPNLPLQRTPQTPYGESSPNLPLLRDQRTPYSEFSQNQQTPYGKNFPNFPLPNNPQASPNLPLPRTPQTPYREEAFNLPIPNNLQTQYTDSFPNLPLPNDTQGLQTPLPRTPTRPEPILPINKETALSQNKDKESPRTLNARMAEYSGAGFSWDYSLNPSKSFHRANTSNARFTTNLGQNNQTLNPSATQLPNPSTAQALNLKPASAPGEKAGPVAPQNPTFRRPQLNDGERESPGLQRQNTMGSEQTVELSPGGAPSQPVLPIIVEIDDEIRQSQPSGGQNLFQSSPQGGDFRGALVESQSAGLAGLQPAELLESRRIDVDLPRHPRVMEEQNAYNFTYERLDSHDPRPNKFSFAPQADRPSLPETQRVSPPPSASQTSQKVTSRQKTEDPRKNQPASPLKDLRSEASDLPRKSPQEDPARKPQNLQSRNLEEEFQRGYREGYRRKAQEDFAEQDEISGQKNSQKKVSETEYDDPSLKKEWRPKGNARGFSNQLTRVVDGKIMRPYWGQMNSILVEEFGRNSAKLREGQKKFAASMADLGMKIRMGAGGSLLDF